MMNIPRADSMRRMIRWLKRRWVPRGFILMYHRVAELEMDPWSLCVTPRHFAEHMEVLRTHSTVMSLQHLVQALERGALPRQAVAVTFDDGYADNLHQAKPVLEHYDIPATIFLAAGYLDSRREFWWDELERLVLHLNLWPETQQRPGEAANTRISNEEDARNAQLKRYYALWEQLYPLPHHERQKILDLIIEKHGVAWEGRPTHRILATDEVVALARDDLIEIGAHTMTHPALALMPMAAQRDEIQQSKQCLEELLERPVQSFSYPHGDYTGTTAALVREGGFTRACTTADGPVVPSSKRFELPRVQVPDSDGDAFGRWLHAWQQAMEV